MHSVEDVECVEGGNKQTIGSSPFTLWHFLLISVTDCLTMVSGRTRARWGLFAVRILIVGDDAILAFEMDDTPTQRVIRSSNWA
jgi:hypothetical protein